MRIEINVTVRADAGDEQEHAAGKRFLVTAEEAAEAFSKTGTASARKVMNAYTIKATKTDVAPNRASLAAARLAGVIKALAAGTLHPDHDPKNGG